MNKKIVLIGGGGHCKSVIDTITNNGEYEIIGITDTENRMGDLVCGISIIGTDDMLQELFDTGINNAFITLGSIGSTDLREKLYDKAKKIGFTFPSIVDKSAVLSKTCEVGEGSFIGKGVILNVAVKIGRNCIINTGSIIEHDCVINDYVHIAPGCVLSGHVVIGRSSHIGTNTTIIQELTIGNHVLVGAGSVVVRSLKDNLKAYGNPCKIQNNK